MSRPRPQYWLIALLALLGLAPTAWSIAPPGQWWNTSYAQRLRVSVTTTTSIVTGYSVKVVLNHAGLVAAGKSLASGDDVRVVYWNGATWTEIDRVLEYGSGWNSATTTMWFKTQAAIGTNTVDDNYYIYYGNAAAGAPPANADNIFLMSDDFTGASLNAAKWTVASGSATVAGGLLTVNANSTVWATAAYSFGTDTRWEAQLRLSVANPATVYYWGGSDVNGQTGNYFSFRSDGSNHRALEHPSGGGTSQNAVTATNTTTLQTYQIDRIGTGQLDF